MDVFVRSIPDQTTQAYLHSIFRPVLEKFSIYTYCCEKLKGRGCAILTIPDEGRAKAFLKDYGSTPGKPARVQLSVNGRPIHCTLSRNKPDKYLVLCLQNEEAERLEKLKEKKHAVERTATLDRKFDRKFDFYQLSCGIWDYIGPELVFVAHFQDTRRGTAFFGTRSLTLLVHPWSENHPSYRVDIPYWSVQLVTTAGQTDPTITFTLMEAPRMYECPAEQSVDGLAQRLGALGLRPGPRTFQRKRVTSISTAHESLVNTCMVYRITLINPRDSNKVNELLKKGREMPPMIVWRTKVIQPNAPFQADISRLNMALGAGYKGLPFGVKFQIQKLVQNAYLPPLKVYSLLDEISEIVDRSGATICINTLRRFFHQIPFAGPETEAAALGRDALVSKLRKNEETTYRESSYLSDLTSQHQHIGLVHKATVTPTGIYLYGPEPEAKNRVLRKYSNYTDYFLRVTFLDEDNEPVRFDRNASMEDVFHKRFKKILGGGIKIADRGYEFLGFSHSSLRSQTCWFMAPFTNNGELLHARLVISRLGNFSEIRSPAKCAARIGQAFSETYSTIHIPDEAVRKINDVEVLGRVFSDGVGTISRGILERIEKEYALSRELKPTVFQVRFKGAKGMLSLDTRLKGDVLNLRPSMIKFDGSDATDIEICSAGVRPLPMYLNRQFIKILEDLGVKPEVFLQLQAKAVERLRRTTLSPVNAASFLERNLIGKAAHLPWIIRKMNDLRFPFQMDPFLRHAVELSVLVQLRELKHRSRILVDEGVTLLGIMDETGILEEGQIYCVTQTEEKPRKVIQGEVTITRAPALHPGDVQVAIAVNVPASSPLCALHNCVVFSQKGKRDLPSQLSGGDLDGDLYNIIPNKGLRPEYVRIPADYLRVPAFDIGCTVERHHMTDFFVQFMENDQLGRIAMQHMAFADQKETGTMDPECLTLASMHSTAVDFSKTGIPVDISKLPRNNMHRPDFMATGPHVVIEEKVNFAEPIPLKQGDDEEDVVGALDPDNKPYRYYESPKILGKLYRAIDERKFFDDLQEQSRLFDTDDRSGKATMRGVLDYVRTQTSLIEWEHHRKWARDIKDVYDDCLIDTISQYSTHPQRRISEVEVFVGSIIGKNGAPNRRQREATTGMKDRYERDVTYIVDCITKNNETGKRAEDALERSIACFAVSLEEGDKNEGGWKTQSLKSFTYVAAAMCLKEVERFQGSFGLPIWA